MNQAIMSASIRQLKKAFWTLHWLECKETIQIAEFCMKNVLKGTVYQISSKVTRDIIFLNTTMISRIDDYKYASLYRKRH